MTMQQRLTRWLQEEKGEGSITFLYTFFLLLIFMYILLDLFGYGSTWLKMNAAANETLEIVKSENGFDQTTRASFMQFASAVGLDPSKITVTGTSKTVQRGTPVEVVATMPYEIKGIRPFGVTLTIPVKVKVTGLAHRYIR